MLGTRIGIYGSQQIADDPTGLILWLDATDSTTMFSDVGGTVPITNGASVRRWNSKSSNGIYLTESTGNAIYQTNQLNSYAAVRCNGANGSYNILRPFGTITGATMIIVMKYDFKTDSSNGAFVQFNTPDAARTYYDTKTMNENFGFGSRQAIVEDTLVFYSIYAIRADSVSNTTKVYKNNITVELASTTYSTTAWLGYDLRFGSTTAASKPVYGNVVEIYLYKQAISVSDLTTKLSDLRTKYGFTTPNYIYNWDVSLTSSLRNSAGNQATDGQIVTTWYERSGSAAASNWLACSTNYGPVYRSSDQSLDFTSGDRLLYITGLTNQPMTSYNKTYVMVVTTPTNTGYGVSINKGAYTTTESFQLQFYNNTIEPWWKGNYRIAFSSTFTANTKMVLAFTLPNAKYLPSIIMKNGVKFYNPSAFGYNNWDPVQGTEDWTFGGMTDGNGRVITPYTTTETYKGKLHELLIYDGLLYYDVLGPIMQTLMTKWGIS